MELRATEMAQPRRLSPSTVGQEKEGSRTVHLGSSQGSFSSRHFLCKNEVRSAFPGKLLLPFIPPASSQGPASLCPPTPKGDEQPEEVLRVQPARGAHRGRRRRKRTSQLDQWAGGWSEWGQVWGNSWQPETAIVTQQDQSSPKCQGWL